MNMLNTLSDINSKVRKLTNSHDSDLPPIESGMSDSMRSLIGSQSQGTRDELPHEQVDLYTPLLTNNYKYIYRGSELYYQSGNMVKPHENSIYTSCFPYQQQTAPTAGTIKSNGQATMENDNGNDQMDLEDQNIGGSLQTNDPPMDYSNKKFTNNEMEETERAHLDGEENSRRTYRNRVRQMKFDLEGAWFHDEDSDSMSYSTTYSHITCPSSDLSDVFHMFVDEDKFSNLSNMHSFQIMDSGPTSVFGRLTTPPQKGLTWEEQVAVWQERKAEATCQCQQLMQCIKQYQTGEIVDKEISFQESEQAFHTLYDYEAAMECINARLQALHGHQVSTSSGWSSASTGRGSTGVAGPPIYETTPPGPTTTRKRQADSSPEDPKKLGVPGAVDKTPIPNPMAAFLDDDVQTCPRAPNRVQQPGSRVTEGTTQSDPLFGINLNEDSDTESENEVQVNEVIVLQNANSKPAAEADEPVVDPAYGLLFGLVRDSTGEVLQLAPVPTPPTDSSDSHSTSQSTDTSNSPSSKNVSGSPADFREDIKSEPNSSNQGSSPPNSPLLLYSPISPAGGPPLSDLNRNIGELVNGSQSPSSESSTGWTSIMDQGPFPTLEDGQYNIRGEQWSSAGSIEFILNPNAPAWTSADLCVPQSGGSERSGSGPGFSSTAAPFTGPTSTTGPTQQSNVTKASQDQHTGVGRVSSTTHTSRSSLGLDLHWPPQSTISSTMPIQHSTNSTPCLPRQRLDHGTALQAKVSSASRSTPLSDAAFSSTSVRGPGTLAHSLFASTSNVERSGVTSSGTGLSAGHQWLSTSLFTPANSSGQGIVQPLGLTLRAPPVISSRGPTQVVGQNDVDDRLPATASRGSTGTSTTSGGRDLRTLTAFARDRLKGHFWDREQEAMGNSFHGSELSSEFPVHMQTGHSLQHPLHTLNHGQEVTAVGEQVNRTGPVDIGVTGFFNGQLNLRSGAQRSGGGAVRTSSTNLSSTSPIPSTPIPSIPTSPTSTPTSPSNSIVSTVEVPKHSLPTRPLLSEQSAGPNNATSVVQPEEPAPAGAPLSTIASRLAELPSNLADHGALYRFLTIFPTFPLINWRDVEKQHIALVEQSGRWQQCDQFISCESLLHFIMSLYRDLLPTAINMVIDANAVNDLQRQQGNNRAEILQQLSDANWYQFSEAMLRINGQPIAGSHGLGPVLKFDCHKTDQELPRAFNKEFLEAIRHQNFTHPELLADFKAGSKNKGFAAIGMRKTLRATTNTALAFMASTHATHSDGSPIVRPSTDAPVPCQKMYLPDAAIPVDCLEESLLMHTGFTRMCLARSEDAPHNPVHLPSDALLEAAYTQYCNGASIAVLADPVTQFITARHDRTIRPGVHEQGKSNIASTQHPMRATSHQLSSSSYNNGIGQDIVANHISEQSCIRCGGYILNDDLSPLSSPATHPDISTCLFHLSIVDAHLKGKLTERQRLQLLNERTDDDGQHFCLVCHQHVDKNWEEGRGHGVVNAESRKYVSLCQRYEILENDIHPKLSETSENNTVSNNNALFFMHPGDRKSSIAPCKYIGSTSSSIKNLPSLDSTAIDLLPLKTNLSHHPRPENQVSLHRDNSSAPVEMKNYVRSSRETQHQGNILAKFSDRRGQHEHADHLGIGNTRHGSENSPNESNGLFPLGREDPFYTTSPSDPGHKPPIYPLGRGHTQRDISGTSTLNQQKSPTSTMIDHAPYPVQQPEPQYDSLPEGWSTGHEYTNRVYTSGPPGPFGSQRETPSSRLGKPVREPTLEPSSDSHSDSRHDSLPAAPRHMGGYVAPVRQESYSLNDEGKNTRTHDEGLEDRGRRHNQSVQWSGKFNDPITQRHRSLPGSLSQHADSRRSPVALTNCSSEVEDIDDGHTPYYMMRPDNQHQTNSRPVSSMALTPYVKSEVDSDSDVVILRKSKKALTKKPIKLYPDADGDSTDSDSHITDKTDDKSSIFSLFTTMTCDAEHTEALLTLKSMLKKSDFIEVKHGDHGQRRNVRFSDYFSEKYSGNARKLKRYLQRLLQYSALSTTDDETRADIVSDGPGLAESCLTKLEQAARVPLPGLASTYDTDSISQKKRLLDLLLTYVILFYQEEQTLALQDLRLKGPMFTGLTDLYHKINTGSTLLHPKHMEDYLLRGILRAENGDGVSLLKSFQNTLRIQKQMELRFSKNDQVYRKLLFTCCNLHTTEDSQVQLAPTITQAVKGGGRRFEQTNYARLDWDVYEDLIEEYTALAEASPAHNSEYQNKGRNDRKQPGGGQDRGRNDSRSQREELFTKRFCMAPCACCGAKNHPMLSPIKSPEGAPLDCDYVCPTAICSNWQEQRRQRNALRFQPCPKKFAAMCHNDTATANTALGEYERIGSGQYRNPSERNAFRRDVLMNCKAPTGPSNYPKRNTAGGSQVEQCHSSSVWSVDQCRNIEDNPPLLPYGNNAEEKHERTTVLEFETNGVSTTPAPSTLGYSALHLLLATRVEPTTEEEVEAIKKGDREKMITRIGEGDMMTRVGGRGCKVHFQMPYGVEHVVRYPEVCGRILADTGSTTSLINRDFARKRGLKVLTTGAEIVLRDVNNGLSSLVDHCMLRLTLTTIQGEHINILILAHCVQDLSHDLLLGTRDLERYQISVMAHRGESQMQINDTIEYLPMLDGLQISRLQRLTSGDKPMC